MWLVCRRSVALISALLNLIFEEKFLLCHHGASDNLEAKWRSIIAMPEKR